MNKRFPTQEEALDILRKNGCADNVIQHCKAVSAVALEIAYIYNSKRIRVDTELIRIGSILHDLGRAKTHSIDHPIVGAEIAVKLGLPSALVEIIKRHLGGGITSSEARTLGWPEGTYIPETIEQKIVSYADKLVEGDKKVSIYRTIRKLNVRLGKNHPSIRRVLNLHKEITKLYNDSKT